MTYLAFGIEVLPSFIVLTSNCALFKIQGLILRNNQQNRTIWKYIIVLAVESPYSHLLDILNKRSHYCHLSTYSSKHTHVVLKQNMDIFEAKPSIPSSNLCNRFKSCSSKPHRTCQTFSSFISKFVFIFYASKKIIFLGSFKARFLFPWKAICQISLNGSEAE